MKSILFVDDDTQVLAGLRRMLSALDEDWDMSFCRSGEAALEAMAERHFDVLVCDLRMAGMDGITVLTSVRHLYPDVVRIVLSGQADRELQIRCTEVAHQFLAKPCDPDELHATITRACRLRDALRDERLLALTAGMSSIPSLPAIYRELEAELRSPSGSLARVGRIISKDIGLTAKVLQLVNSAFFGLPQQVASPEQAASFLGLDTIRALALGVQVFTRYERVAEVGLDLEAMLEHTTRVARVAGKIAEAEGVEGFERDQCTLAGMMHELGTLVLATEVPERFVQSRRVTEKLRLPLHEMERRAMGASHGRVGAYLLGIWGLPAPVIEAVAFHEDPSCVSVERFSPLVALVAADCLCRDPVDRERLALVAGAEAQERWGELCAPDVRAVEHARSRGEG